MHRQMPGVRVTQHPATQSAEMVRGGHVWIKSKLASFITGQDFAPQKNLTQTVTWSDVAFKNTKHETTAVWARHWQCETERATLGRVKGCGALYVITRLQERPLDVWTIDGNTGVLKKFPTKCSGQLFLAVSTVLYKFWALSTHGETARESPHKLHCLSNLSAQAILQQSLIIQVSYPKCTVCYHLNA